MEIKPIKTEADYRSALKEIERLFHADPDTPEGDRADVLMTLVEAYEAKHHPIPLPDPIEAIAFRMERLGLTRKDLEPCIGKRARVADILNRRRPLTLDMIRKLEDKLGIPAAVLVQRYDLVATHIDLPIEAYLDLPWLRLQDVKFIGISHSSPLPKPEETWRRSEPVGDNAPIHAENWPKGDPCQQATAGQMIVDAH